MAKTGQKRDTLKAAQHVAEGVLTDGQIAKAAGIPRRTFSRLLKNPAFVAQVAQIRAARAQGASAAAEERAFDTVTRLIALANMPPEETNGSIHGQVRACLGIAAIRGEIVHFYNDVTERLKNKSAEELDFIAIHRRDPIDADELEQFTSARKKKPQ